MLWLFRILFGMGALMLGGISVPSAWVSFICLQSLWTGASTWFVELDGRTFFPAELALAFGAAAALSGAAALTAAWYACTIGADEQ